MKRSALEALQVGLEALKDRERMVVRLYSQGFSLDEVGQVFGFTEVRACQIYGEAIKALRAIVLSLTDEEEARIVDYVVHRLRMAKRGISLSKFD